VNSRKLADAIRLLVPVILAVADAIEDDESEAPARAPAPVRERPREQRPRGPRIPTGIEVSDTDRKAAEKAAAGKGMLGS
jgi:hypothetical protein